MKITTIGRKCTIRDSFKEHAEKKLKKVDRFFGDAAEAKITATVEKNCQIVEITVINNSMVFRSQERADNMNDALDLCVDSLIRQIRKIKLVLRRKYAKLRSTILLTMLLSKKTILRSYAPNQSTFVQKQLMKQS